MLAALLVGLLPSATSASTPSSGTLTDASPTVTWSGGPYTVATPETVLCVDASVNCDTFALSFGVPADYWDSHEGGVTVAINWASSADDFDLYIQDASGAKVGWSAAGGTTSERVNLGKLAPGTYTVQVVAWLTAGASYTGAATLTSTATPAGM